jgi:hypothetical protein
MTLPWPHRLLLPVDAGRKPGGKAEAMPHNQITGDKIAGATVAGGDVIT